MTRSNLHIKLSNGKSLICVADSSSAPEQGYIVETIILPLLNYNDNEIELLLLNKHCTMNERRANATYRYTIDLITKDIRLFEEHFDYEKKRFRRGKDITKRYRDYLKTINRNIGYKQI